MEESIFNLISVVSLIATAAMAVVAYFITLNITGHCKSTDKLVVFWLTWDAMIHFLVVCIIIDISFILEKLNAIREDKVYEPMLYQHFDNEKRKEYGKADYRWLVSDPTIVSLEVLTVLFDGPLCVILIYAICQDRYYRHWIQIVLCTCELYGGWMTFAPDWLQGSPNLNTSNWLYLWVYLVFFNGLWVVIPLLLMYQSWQAMKNAFQGKGFFTRITDTADLSARKKFT